MPSTTTLDTAALHVGTSVRHPSRGIGKVSTIVYAPLTRAPTKAWVEFASAHGPRKFVCWVDDLVVLSCEASSPRATLRVIEHADTAGAA